MRFVRRVIVYLTLQRRLARYLRDAPSRTLLTSPRMGELEPWIDENFIRSVWFGMGETVNVKMIRDKFSGWVPH